MSVKPYFIFSQTEKTGMLAVMILIIGIILLPRIIYHNSQKLQVKKENILSYLKDDATEQQNDILNTEKIDLNLANEQELQNLPCIDAIIAKRIVAYREKVKPFERTEDIKKVYGLQDNCYEKLLPYIFVSSVSQKNETTTPLTFQKINLNTCDSVQLVQLKGIGAKTARQILQIRNKAKVFYDLKQLYCLGLRSEVVEHLQNQCYIEPDALNKIEKISLNTIEEKKVFHAAGFTYNIAKAFVKYRKKVQKQGKTLTSWEEITQNVDGINKEWLNCWQVYYTL